MYSINQQKLTFIFDSAYRFASEESFFKNFTEQSRAGNEDKIIEITRGIPALENLTLGESYVPKNDEEAKRFLKEAERTEKINIRLFRLNEALFAAKINSQDRKIIFFDILICLIRGSFASERFNKCLKYCRYLALLLSEKNSPENLREKDREIYKIECFSYEARCLKIFGAIEEAKASARNGIKEAKNLFQKMSEEGESISDQEKLERLSPFLGVLNESRNKSGLKSLPAGALEMESREISAPQVCGERNKRLKSCCDAVALRYDAERGRHLVATRNIKTGSVLIVDKPFSWSSDEDMIDSNCLHCHEPLESSEAVQIPCHNCQTVSSWQNSYHQISHRRDIDRLCNNCVGSPLCLLE